VDEDEFRRMKQRQTDRERIEQQQAKLSTQSGDSNDGLRVSSVYYFPSIISSFLF
jgi:hypothetical protein